MKFLKPRFLGPLKKTQARLLGEYIKTIIRHLGLVFFLIDIYAKFPRDSFEHKRLNLSLKNRSRAMNSEENAFTGLA